MHMNYDTSFNYFFTLFSVIYAKKRILCLTKCDIAKISLHLSKLLCLHVLFVQVHHGRDQYDSWASRGEF